jgi:hypothetical protein
LLASSAAVQAVTAIMRVTTSYRILELGLPVVWLGIVSPTYAVLPVFLAVWLGRFVDRGHDALATWIGSAVMAVACAGLWASGGSTASLLLSNALLGIAAMPFGASLVAAVAGAGGIFVIIAVSLLGSGAAVYASRPQK